VARCLGLGVRAAYFAGRLAYVILLGAPRPIPAALCRPLEYAGEGVLERWRLEALEGAVRSRRAAAGWRRRWRP
jgi:hypothetical protein